MLYRRLSGTMSNLETVGITVFIPRIDLSPIKEEIPFNIRRQFPIRLGFAMTINESQE